jgi:hypothetical protein
MLIPGKRGRRRAAVRKERNLTKEINLTKTEGGAEAMRKRIGKVIGKLRTKMVMVGESQKVVPRVQKVRVGESRRAVVEIAKVVVEIAKVVVGIAKVHGGIVKVVVGIRKVHGGIVKADAEIVPQCPDEEIVRRPEEVRDGTVKVGGGRVTPGLGEIAKQRLRGKAKGRAKGESGEGAGGRGSEYYLSYIT